MLLLKTQLNFEDKSFCRKLDIKVARVVNLKLVFTD